MTTKDKDKKNKSTTSKAPLKDLKLSKQQSCKVQGGVVSGGLAGPEDWSSTN